VRPLDEAGAAELRALLEAHIRHTDSARGAELLEDWEHTASSFRMVVARR
jgi:glutamate synthase domain-containing protein 3